MTTVDHGLGLDFREIHDTSVQTTASWIDQHSAACLIRQKFHYEYTGPIRDLDQRLIIVPPERHGSQRLVTHRLEVSSPTTEVHREIDQFGNLVLRLLIDHVPDEIDFLAWIVVEHEQNERPIVVDRDLFESPVLRSPTLLTEPDRALHAEALNFEADTLDPGTLARAINQHVYESMRYEPGSTDIATTAAEAFANRSGVCQDYAHIMLSLCRICGLPARYVSGHLLGEGATHAWVEVLLQDEEHPARVRALPLDPTHGVEPGVEYVTVATGRDYSDVAPTSGTFISAHQGTLSAHKHAALSRPSPVR